MRRLLLSLGLLAILWGGAQAQGPVQVMLTYSTTSACASPDCVSSASLKLWLKADAIGGLSDGDNITSWTDSSGNGNTATTAGPTHVKYRTNVVNGLPAASFGELGRSYFTFPDFASGFSAGEVFIVVELDEDPPLAIENTGFWSFGTQASFGEYVPYTDGHIYDDWGSTTRRDLGSSSGQLASWSVYSLWSASNDYAAAINNSSIFTSGTNTVAFRTDIALGTSVIGEYLMRGKVAEVIMYNGKLSSGDRTIVFDYIEAKYGISLP